jgi:hypothetical protein
VHNGTEMTVLQVVTCLMGMKSKYTFSNQYYNDIVIFINHLKCVMLCIPSYVVYAECQCLQ